MGGYWINSETRRVEYVPSRKDMPPPPPKKIKINNIVNLDDIYPQFIIHYITHGFNPFALVQVGSDDILHLLNFNLVDPNMCRERDNTSILFFAAQYGHINIVQLLVMKGAMIDKIESDGTTPLMIAVMAGHVNIVEYLLHAGANPNIIPYNNIGSSLMLACMYNHERIVELLLRYGANKNIIIANESAMDVTNNSKILSLLV